MSLLPTRPAHAEFAPSSLAYREKCPGFKPSSGDSHAALEGTLLHKAMETGNFKKLNPEQLLLAKWAAGIRRAIFDRLKERAHGPIDSYHELFLDIDSKTEVFGTLDELIIASPAASTIEYKFGRLPVPPPKDNLQVQAYVLGTFERFPQLAQISAFICQPRLEYVGEHTFLRTDKTRIRRRVRKVVAEAKQNDPQKYASGEYCSYCARQGECPLWQGLALRAAKGYDVEHLPAQWHPSKLTNANDVATALNLARGLATWIDSVKFHANQFALETNEEIPGYELSTRKGAETLNVGVDFIKLLHEKYGISLDPGKFFDECCSISAAKFFKMIEPHFPKEVRKKRMETVRGELFTQGMLEMKKPTQHLRKSKS